MPRVKEMLTRPKRARPAAAPHSALTGGVAPWARVIVAALARTVLLMVVIMSLWAAAPALLGWHTTTVMSGSMQPKINPGDVVSARQIPSANLQLGQVLLVDDPDHPDRLRLHRLVRFGPEGKLILRGDANRDEDSSPVDRSAVRGVGALRVPYVAAPIQWLHELAWVKLVILLAVILTLVAATGLDRETKPVGEHEPEPSGPDEDPKPPEPR